MSSEASSEGELYVISAPSGAGKTSLIAGLLKRCPRLALSVSDTTRAPRGGEVEGEHYHFIDPGAFKAGIAAGRYLEHAQVFGNYYGTAHARLQALWRQGRDALLEIDVQGAAQVQTSHPRACCIFILPPSLAVLEARLVGRGTDAPEVIRRRLDEARREIRHADRFDFLLINDDFDTTLDDLTAVVRAWPFRRTRQLEKHAGLLRELLERD